MLHDPTTVTVAVRIVPHHTIYPPVARVALLTDKGKRKPHMGGRAAGRLNTRDRTWNLSLKEITDTKGPVPIRFEVRDKQTLIPLDEHVAHWSSYIGEVIRGVSLYHPSWLKVPKERKAALFANIGEHCPSRSKSAKPGKEHGHISTGIPSLACLRDEMSSTTQEYPSLIDTFFMARTVNREFPRDEDRRIYFDSGGASGIGGSGTTRRVPTIRTMRMRMAMAIVSCVIYGTILDGMSPGNMCHHGTNNLTGKYVRPTVSVGIIVEEVNPVLILQYFPHVLENHGKAHAPSTRRVTTFYLEYAPNEIEYLFIFYLLISLFDRIRNSKNKLMVYM
nr:hypothetical protein [Tanacetum cinerariifolium]